MSIRQKFRSSRNLIAINSRNFIKNSEYLRNLKQMLADLVRGFDNIIQKLRLHSDFPDFFEISWILRQLETLVVNLHWQPRRCYSKCVHDLPPSPAQSFSHFYALETITEEVDKQKTFIGMDDFVPTSFVIDAESEKYPNRLSISCRAIFFAAFKYGN